MAGPLFPDMLHEHMVSKVRALSRKRSEERARIRTRAQAKKLVLEVRRKMKACFRPFPKRTPLNVKVTGTAKRKTYTILKLVYESRPRLLVSADMYVPDGTGPFPCVLGTCGHSGDGKACDLYQTFSQSLCRLGYLVLIYDPVSQGERIQYPSPKEGRPYPGQSCTREHNMAGNQMALVGDFFGTWRAWDGMRGLDVLLKHPKADRKHVGVTGNSGGGTLSSFITALDPRITMAAPSCYVTTFLRNLENSLPADSEQNPPGILGRGLDMADYFISYAPRPVLLLGQKYDYFDRRGLEQTYREVRRMYELLGAGENAELFIGPTSHGYRKENREAMYRFFNRHAGVRRATSEKILRPRLEPEKVINAAGGQVRKLKSRRVFDFTKAEALRLAAEHKPVGEAKLKRILPQLLALPERNAPPHYRILRPRWHFVNGKKKSKFHGEGMYLVETEPEVKIPLTRFFSGESSLLMKLEAPRRVTLHVPHHAASEEVDHKRGTVFGRKAKEAWFVEPRGIGDTMAQDTVHTEFTAPYGLDFMHAAFYDMLLESVAGRRVHDVLAVLDLLKANGAKEVHLVGRGIGGVTCAFAALLHPVVKQVTLHNTLLSFHELTQVPIQSWPFSCMVRGILKHCDLPDVYRVLAAKKKLVHVAPWTSQYRPYTAAALRKAKKELGLARVTIRK